MAIQFSSNYKPTYVDLNFNVGTNSFSELLYDVDAIRNSLYNLFTTPIGTRVFVPEYGSHLYRMVYEPVDATSATELRVYVGKEVERWEPRVILLDKDILVQPVFGGFNINLTYTIRMTGVSSNFELTATR